MIYQVEILSQKVTAGGSSSFLPSRSAPADG